MRQRTDYIVIHCSYTPPSMDIGADAIREWHLKRGWSDIGYHYVIRRNGKIENGRHVGNVGAHAKGYNQSSVGICLVGGKVEGRTAAEDVNYTRAQWEALEGLVYSLKVDYREAVIIGHRDLPGVSKTCPVFDVQAWWNNR